jgi:hypothetical protein
MLRVVTPLVALLEEIVDTVGGAVVLLALLLVVELGVVADMVACLRYESDSCVRAEVNVSGFNMSDSESAWGTVYDDSFDSTSVQLEIYTVPDAKNTLAVRRCS